MPVAKMARRHTDTTAKSVSIVGLASAAFLRKSEVKAFVTYELGTNLLAT